MKRISSYVVFLACLLNARSLLSDRLQIVSPVLRENVAIKVINVNGGTYFCAQDFARALSIRSYYRQENGKLVLFFPKTMVKLAVNCSFIMLDNRLVQMPLSALLVNRDVFVPLFAFMEVIRTNELLPDLQYRIVTGGTDYLVQAVEPPTAESPGATLPKHRISSSITLSEVTYEEKQNGLTIKLSSAIPHKDTDFSYFFRGSEWLYITILGAHCDSAALSRIRPTPSVEKLEAIPLGKSVQIAVRLKKRFEKADVQYDERSGKILVSLFLPLDRATLKKIEEVKNAWIVDTIVLDPGHGGKDGGTAGRWGYMNEKDIVLDIALRLSKLLERRRDLKVILTRREDELIPLWKRTQIANDAAGKLFISLHINAMPEHAAGTADGVELYLLNPSTSSKEAIEVARLENAVIQLETNEDKVKYKNYDNPSHILANMVYMSNLHDSEKFTEILARHLVSTVPLKFRGVKQANFYVLVGAAMPNLLCEFGYNDHKNDARKLNDPAHRQKIAEALYKSIIEFKEYCDRSVAQNN